MEYTSGEDKTCNLCDSVEGCNFGEKCKSAYLMKVDVPIESDGDSLGVNERNKKQDHTLTQRKVCHWYNSEKGCKFGVHCRYDHKDQESTQGKIFTDNAPNVQSTNKQMGVIRIRSYADGLIGKKDVKMVIVVILLTK